MKNIHAARLSQLLFLVLFLVLFVQTEYRGTDTISAAVNGFFRMDPLVLAGYAAATRSFTMLLLPALLVLIFTLILGRFFCGWICPMGTAIDLVTDRIRKYAPLRFLQGNFKYWLLLPLLSAAVFNINVVGILDPIAILLRALTFFFYPFIGDSVRRGWSNLYLLLEDKRDFAEPAYAAIRDNLMPFRETFYPLAFVSAIMFLAIIVLERYERRNWCRNLCPLGTLLGLAARFSPFRRIPAGLCSDCKACREFCPTSFGGEILQHDECILCMECVSGCPSSRARFSFEKKPAQPFLPGRRVVLTGLALGFCGTGFLRFREPDAAASVLRPPGVRDEKAFLSKCVRCGECMKVCLKGGLYPAVLQAGAEGLFTPVLVPRLGYCEYNCNLCGQVCPTAAIPNLPVEEKKRQVMGKAVFDKNHCLPFARRTNCIVCEEHCPIPQKAIRSEVVEEAGFDGKVIRVQKPHVVEELCNGCGICENVCPVEGNAGIKVFAVSDRTPLEEQPNSGADWSDPYGL